MGQGIETVGFFVDLAAVTTAQAMTACTGQSATVRAAASPQTGVTLEALFGYSQQGTGDVRIRSPRMHDDVNGIRVGLQSVSSNVIAREAFQQSLYSQDTLTVEQIYGTAPTAGDYAVSYLQIYYDDLPGVAGNYRPWSQVQPNIVDYLSVPVSPSSSATKGQWGTGVAINSTVDVFKANTLYALIGYVCQSQFGAFTIQGVDLGNLQMGGPGSTSVMDTRNFFQAMEMASGKPSIPVINSQNKSTTNVFVSDVAASTAYEISLVFVQLSQ